MPTDADRDRHRPDLAIADVILGAQDGLVNMLGVVLGVAAASNSVRVVAAAGLAGAFSEAASMAAVAYTSKRAEGERYESERARERRHIRADPAAEREEIRALFRQRGFEGELLEQVVSKLTADEETWIDLMMVEEHRLVPIDARRALRSAVIVGIASLVGSLVPLAPYAVVPLRAASWLAAGFAGTVLFALGAYKARVTVGRPTRSGVTLMAIGLASALLGYAIGTLFGA